MKTLFLNIILLALMAGLISCKRANVRNFEKTPDGIKIALRQGILQLDVVSSRIIHVRQSPTGRNWNITEANVSGPDVPTKYCGPTGWNIFSWCIKKVAFNISVPWAVVLSKEA